MCTLQVGDVPHGWAEGGHRTSLLHLHLLVVSLVCLGHSIGVQVPLQ